jgi:hypothetical protein
MRRPALLRCLTVAALAATVVAVSTGSAAAAPGGTAAPAGHGQAQPTAAAANYIVTLAASVRAPVPAASTGPRCGATPPG